MSQVQSNGQFLTQDIRPSAIIHSSWAARLKIQRMLSTVQMIHVTLRVSNIHPATVFTKESRSYTHDLASSQALLLIPDTSQNTEATKRLGASGYRAPLNLHRRGGAPIPPKMWYC